MGKAAGLGAPSKPVASTGVGILAARVIDESASSSVPDATVPDFHPDAAELLREDAPEEWIANSSAAPGPRVVGGSRASGCMEWSSPPDLHGVLATLQGRPLDGLVPESGLGSKANGASSLARTVPTTAEP